MSSRKICVVTGTRAEYGLFYPLLREIEKRSNLELQLIVSTMHLSTEFGLTYKEIEKDGFRIDAKIENLLSSDSKASIAKSTALATLLLSDNFERLQPDIILLLGDRYETLAAATTALLMNIPIAHIHGGEITEGAVDEQIRHAITKMSYLHFASTQEYAHRICQMGESSTRVICSGAPGIDNIVHFKLLSKKGLEESLEWKIEKPLVLFTYHPVTLDCTDIEEEIQKILATVTFFDVQILFTYANSDDGGRIINKNLEEFCQQSSEKYKVVKSLGQLRYLSAMKVSTLLLGNSSSGIIEAASFQKPVINIGSRQKGRLQSGNVIDCEIKDLSTTITKALSREFQDSMKEVNNIYGNGNATKIIVDSIEKSSLSTIKKFAKLIDTL